MPKSFREYLSGPQGFAFVAVGLVGAGLVCWYLWIGRSATPLANVTLSVGASLLSFGLGATAHEAVRIIREGREIRQFKEFFGPGAFSDKGYPTVFLQAELPLGPEGSGVKQPNLKLSDPPDRARETLPKGITHIIPFEDLQAVLEIDGLFHRFNGKLDLQLDTYKRNPLPAQGCLAIGLGYNNTTLRLEDKINGLYEVTYDSLSDDFVVGRGRNKVQVPADCDDYALIARVLVRDPAGKPIPHIVCAGHSAPATAVACRYLAEYWQSLVKEYQKDDPQVPKRLDQFNMAAVLWYRRGDKHLEPRFEAITKQ